MSVSRLSKNSKHHLFRVQNHLNQKRTTASRPASRPCASASLLDEGEHRLVERPATPPLVLERTYPERLVHFVCRTARRVGLALEHFGRLLVEGGSWTCKPSSRTHIDVVAGCGLLLGPMSWSPRQIVAIAAPGGWWCGLSLRGIFVVAIHGCCRKPGPFCFRRSFHMHIHTHELSLSLSLILSSCLWPFLGRAL